MLVTLELSDDNWTRIEQYALQHDLSYQLFLHDPYYRVCVIRCASKHSVWLSLIS